MAKFPHQLPGGREQSRTPAARPEGGEPGRRRWAPLYSLLPGQPVHTGIAVLRGEESGVQGS